MEISIGILAGGKSTRFGQDKAFAKLKNKTFWNIITDEFSGFKDRIISSDSETKFVTTVQYRIVTDVNKEIGPVEGIRQILLNAVNKYTFICAVDMPFIQKEITDYLVQFVSSDYDCYIITFKNKPNPLCGIYSKSILNILEDSIKNRDYKILNLLKKVRTKYISLEYSCFSEKIIHNINTVEQFRESKFPYVFCVSGVKNSGKTTLIKKLLKVLQKDFRKIAVIKHDGHDFEVDYKGTDTYQFSEQGIEHISIFSKKKFAQIIRKSMKIEEIISQINGMDLIIIEGLKYSSYPKIEIVRKGVSVNPVCEKNSLIALVTNNNEMLLNNNGIISMDNTELIAETITKYFDN